MSLAMNLGYESPMALHADGNNDLARGPACGVCPPDLLLVHPELSVLLIYYSL